MKKEDRSRDNGFDVITWDLTINCKKKQLEKAIKYCFDNNISFEYEYLDPCKNNAQLYIEEFPWSERLKMFADFLHKECDNNTLED